MEEVQIGYIIGSFKVDGEVKIISTTSFNNERFKANNKVFFYSKENQKQELSIQSSFFLPDSVVVRFNEINSKEIADTYKGVKLFAYKDESLLYKDQYYYIDLEGCKVINQDNVIVGIVTKVEEFPAQITLRIRGNKKEDVLIPFIKTFVKSVDIHNKIINVSTIEGML